MKTCPRCKATNRDEARFCGFCGASLEALPLMQAEATLTCPVCSAENKSDAKFCGACGAGLEQEPVLEPSPVAAEAPEEVPVAPVQPPAEPTAAPMAAPEAAPAEVAHCAACGYTVHYCPSCGAPLQQASDRSSSQSEETPQSQ